VEKWIKCSVGRI